MGLVNFGFKKISAERIKDNIKGAQAKQDLVLKNIGFRPVGKNKDELIELEFVMSVEYNPGIAKLVLEGVATFVESAENTALLKESYKKTKKLPAKWGLNMLNIVLIRSNIKLLALEQEINVPPHMQMPTLGAKAKVSDYIG